MQEAFVISLRESIQASIILLAIISFFDGHKKAVASIVSGAVTGLVCGIALGSSADVNESLTSQETWTFIRYSSDTVIFYLAIVFAVIRLNAPSSLPFASLPILGFVIVFFDAGSAAFLIRDIGMMKQALNNIILSASAGLITGLVPLFAIRKSGVKIPMREIFTLPGLMMTVGALRFIFGGVGELEKGTVLTVIQKGLLGFLNESVRYAQAVLLLPGHPFIKAPLSGLADFLAGDRTAMAISVLFITAPPLYILIDLFAMPEPLVGDLDTGARRRSSIAFFRREMVYQAAPVLTALSLMIILLHQGNLSVNPLYEPQPVPVREEDNTRSIKIQLSCKSGDFSDGKVKKFVYYYGNKQVLFLAIQKPDGSMGLALDECEICRPAQWNKDAQGYAQRGGNLVCKYCMTPIAIPTINNPGGCNPIPVPFKANETELVISLDDLIRVYNSTQELEKKGTHF